MCPCTVASRDLLAGRVPDGARPPLSLPQVSEGVPHQLHAEALLHLLARRARAHPPAAERVEIGDEVRGDAEPAVRVPLPVGAAAHAVRQAEHRLGVARRRGDLLDGQGALRQAHRVPDPLVQRVGELPVQRPHEAVPESAARLPGHLLALHPAVPESGGALERGAGGAPEMEGGAPEMEGGRTGEGGGAHWRGSAGRRVDSAAGGMRDVDKTRGLFPDALWSRVCSPARRVSGPQSLPADCRWNNTK